MTNIEIFIITMLATLFANLITSIILFICYRIYKTKVNIINDANFNDDLSILQILRYFFTGNFKNKRSSCSDDITK